MVKWLFGLILLFWQGSAFASTSPFKPGERLVYDVSWFIFSAGESGLEVRELEIVNGIPCYHFVAWAKSTIAFFFKVDDRVEGYATTETLRPVRFEKYLHEGKYKKDLVINFDLNNGTAKYGSEAIPVSMDCRDVLGSFYYFRTMQLPEIGKEIKVCVHTDKKNYPLAIEVLKKEQVEVDAGKFNTVKVILKPAPGFEGLFRNKGSIWIWFTDDERRIPVKIKAEVPILGSVNIELKKPR